MKRILVFGLLAFFAAPDRATRIALQFGKEWSGTLPAGRAARFTLPTLQAGETYAVNVALTAGDLSNDERVPVRFNGVAKQLDAGDPSIYFQYRPDRGEPEAIEVDAAPIQRPLPARVIVERLPLAAADRAAIEAEPNDTWQQANPLVLGRAVYGSADDVHYLANRYEAKDGLDWFRIDITESEPRLVFFELDLLDRDISPNLKLYRLNEKQELDFYTAGKDPMEIIHDRQEQRYSKFITRILNRGTYFLQVAANHPMYVLRTTAYPAPPYSDPRQAVETAAHYIVNIGDAWFAQTPRNGDVYSRRNIQHDGTMRCTACHPTVFPTESALIAKRNGYPVKAKAQLQYLLDRIYNAPTPLYGSDAYFMRFIGIALQAAGKQGGVAADYEALVSGYETPNYSRWAGFLTQAWSHRRTVADLPPDEPNGVVPIDSAFGFALRDWRVLREQVRRTGDSPAAASAANIEAILTGPEALTRVKNMQDRVLRLQALLEMGREKYGDEIRRHIEELWRMQNPDGGWSDGIKTVSADGSQSAEYLTGQIAYVLMQAGARPQSEPRLDRALRWLLARQKTFGGWFQTGDTGENFQTPMRETRYAIEALAAAYPKEFRKGFENREHCGLRAAEGGFRNADCGLKTARSLRDKLDALDGIWEPQNSETLRLIASYLEPQHPALLRAGAAATLARVGDETSVEPLARRLGDPVRGVSQAAAYAPRRLGNRGISLDAVKTALNSPSPLIRRGATRVFAYQFYGMDHRLDVAEQFVPLLADSDLSTRLAASRTLTQWWYRTADLPMKKRIVEALAARSAVEREHEVMRQNLSNELYVLLDEHLPPSSIHIDRWSEYLPGGTKERVRKAREQVERDILLAPIFHALLHGPEHQRRLMLSAFDGAPWRQRAYARYPYTAADIGNDREFKLLYQPPQPELDALFERLFEIENDAAARRNALQLAQFFRVPALTTSSILRRLFVDAMQHGDDGVRRVAREIVAKDLALDGSAELLYPMLESADLENRRVAIELAARARAVAADAGVRQRIRSGVGPQFLPVQALQSGAFTEAEAASLIERAWPAQSVDARQQLLAFIAASPAGANVVRLAAQDESSLVRERAWRLNTRALNAELLARGLDDSSPAVRVAALRAQPDVAEPALLKLALDRDRAVRLEVLRAIEKRGLHRHEAAARRIRALADDDDTEIRSVALKLLRAGRWNVAAIEPDGRLEKEGLPDFYFFKEKVNPFFYRAGLDGLACANCHATHDILRIVEPRQDKSPLTGEEVRINYHSALKVVDLRNVDQSLILRKPRSPYGQGEASAESPTGVTHVGGDRWTNNDGGMYYTLLQWIRGARVTAQHK